MFILLRALKVLAISSIIRLVMLKEKQMGLDSRAVTCNAKWPLTIAMLTCRNLICHLKERVSLL
jgi:hypothetical protein